MSLDITGSNSITEAVQRMSGEPYRRTSKPDYIVIVQIISLHQRGGMKPEWVDESDPAEVARYATLPEALRHAETISDNIRLIGACDRCSGSGQLEGYSVLREGDEASSIVTCPDCKGEGR